MGQSGRAFALCFTCREAAPKCPVADCGRALTGTFRACFDHRRVAIPQVCTACGTAFSGLPFVTQCVACFAAAKRAAAAAAAADMMAVIYAD